MIYRQKHDYDSFGLCDAGSCCTALDHPVFDPINIILYKAKRREKRTVSRKDESSSLQVVCMTRARSRSAFAGSGIKAVSRRYQESIKALSRQYKGGIKAAILFPLYCRGFYGIVYGCPDYIYFWIISLPG